MTSPTSPYDAITPSQEQDALDSITRMMTGTQMLQDQPGVVYALQQQQAHPADAQAIDQFMQALDAEKQVRLAQAAQASGLPGAGKIILSPEQKTRLDAIGMDYSSVEFTHQDAINQTAQLIEQSSGGKQTVKRNADGSVALDANGQIQVEDTAKQYKAKGIGRLFHDLNNWIAKPVARDVVDPTMTGLNKAWNAVSSSISDVRQQNMAGLHGGAEAAVQASQSRASDMQAQGYDPNNIWSRLAFQSSGKAHSDLTPLADKWDSQNPTGLYGMNGQEAVNEVTRFLADPKKYQQEIENDPANYATDANGQQVMTDAGKAKLAMLSSDQFSTLAKEVSAHTASVGNDVANSLHIDPVHQSTLYALTAAGANLAAAFIIDPTMIAGRTVQAAKLGQVGIDTLGDSERAAAILDPTKSTGLFQRGLQRRTQNFLDMTHQMGAAEDAGDTVKATGLRAHINAQFPEWSPLVPDVLGKNQLLPASQWVERDGKIVESSMYGAGEPIRTLADMADYIASRSGLIRLMNGRAAAQASLMPGSVSGYGLRAIKGAGAQWMTERSAARAERAYETVVSRAEADPGLAEKLIKSGDLIRIQPEADDAVNAVTDNVIAHKPFVNFRDDVHATLAALKGRHAPVAAERGALNSELDDLEERLQALMADKSADPAELAHLHDAIQTGRDLLASSEGSNAALTSDIKSIEKLARGLDAEVNPSTAGSQFGNFPIAKVATGEVNGLASAQRAASKLELTPAGKGNVALNMRRYGDPLGEGGWARPTAIAARARLGAQRLSTLLPRNTEIKLNDAASSEKIYRLAMTYLNRGDANALRVAWDMGDGGQRKAIIGGLIDQIGHSAGLGKSETGRNILDTAKTKVEAYSSVGDDVVIDGQPVALHAGQVRSEWLLPTFQQLQKASAKIGAWEGTFGRALTRNEADLLMSQIKLAWLFKPSTVTRNQLEGWLRTALEGKFGDAVKAKAFATMPNKELWKRGLALESKAKYEELIAGGKLEEAQQLAKSTMLGGDVLGRSGVGQRIADFAPFALTGRAYRHMTGKFMDEGMLASLATLGPEELTHAMEGYGQQILESDLGLRNAARQSTEVAKAGYGPALLRRAVNRAMRKADKGNDESNAWKLQETGDMIGAERYANALAQRVNLTPNVARAALDFIEKPEQFDISHVVAALDDPAIRGEMHMTGYGSVYWTDPTQAAIKATTPAQVQLGKEEWARKVVNDYRYLLTGQNGTYQEDLAKYIRTTGKAPDADWITNRLIGDNRPHSVLAPEVTAVPNGGERGLISSLQDVEGAAYQWLVERPLQRTTSSPVFLANYAEARHGLNPTVEKLIGQGISEEAAGNLAKELSIRNAWVKTEGLIDDPGQKAQFDVIARNIFPFSRATQAMIRRWGGGLWQDPTRARKMMLAYEGAVQSGLIYNNAYGEPTFVYPGSGVMNMMMREIAKIPWFENFARFPISASMTGGVLMSVPGADNPLRMSMGPMITIPLREISKLLPGDQKVIFDEVDSAINGPIGVGQTFSQLEPTMVKRFFDAMNEDQRNSALASSTVGAIANLAAAGMVPAADASPAEREAFVRNIQAQVRSQLFLRAVFGIFAPASPSQPSEGTAGSQADYAFHVRGVGQLSDEYKTILNDVGGDLGRANAIWTALHPEATVYEFSRSQATASKVSLPATKEALTWLNSNAGFVKKYGSVAAYFLPESSGNEPFSDQAYKAQLELGLRQRKTPTEFMNDLYVRNAEAVFYPTVDQWDAQIKALKAAGQDTSQLTAAKSQWETDFKNLNPLFGQKIDSYSDARATATGQLANLRQMVKEGSVPDGQGPQLEQLISAYDGYVQFTQAHKGQTNDEIAARDAALQMFDAWAKSHVAGTPLADLYNGVFRTLNTNLVNLNPPAGGA